MTSLPFHRQCGKYQRTVRRFLGRGGYGAADEHGDRLADRDLAATLQRELVWHRRLGRFRHRVLQRLCLRRWRAVHAFADRYHLDLGELHRPAGHTYGFYSVATDYAGNVQATPATAQATTILSTATPTPTPTPTPSHSDPDAHTNTDAHTDTNAHTGSDAHTNTDAHPYANADPDTNARTGDGPGHPVGDPQTVEEEDNQGAGGQLQRRAQPGPAQNVGDYQLAALGKAKKSGVRPSKPVALGSAVYNPAMNTVTLTPRGTVPNETLQLTIDAALILDAQGQPIQGNQGGNVVEVFGKAGISLARTADPSAAVRVSAEAFDALLPRDILNATRVRRRER